MTSRSTLVENSTSETASNYEDADIHQLEASRNHAARNVRLLIGGYGRLALCVHLAISRHLGPSGVPSDLLLNRPDLAAAYQSLRAADPRVDISHTDPFPSHALTVAAGKRAEQAIAHHQSNLAISPKRAARIHLPFAFVALASKPT